MSAEITTEYVRAKLRDEHYTMLTPCDNRLDKFMCLCPVGHPWLTNWSYWCSGSRCPRCGVICNHDASRLSQEEVKARLSACGYELLCDYQSANKKIKYRCPNGHTGAMTLGNFSNGKRCPVCSRIAGGEKRRRSFNDLKEKSLKNGYLPLFTEWCLGTELADFQCLDCGNVIKVQVNSIVSGNGGCKYCRGKRIVKARYANGTVPTSKQQIKLVSLFGGQMNYPVGDAALDIAFPDIRLYVEYDGSGHELSVLRGEITKEAFDEKQKRRSYGLMNDGWRCIRIVSKKDFLPCDEVLLSLFHNAKEYLDGGHHYYSIFIDEGRIKTSHFETDYDFGELKKLPRSR